jgi:hypothetical protein
VAAAAGAAADLELIGIVDDRFDPQHAAVLVGQLDPVGLHRVLHPGAGPAALPVVQDLAAELAVELAAQEREHVLGAQAERGVAEEPGVERPQGEATPEQDVGGVLGLVVVQ